MQPMIIILPSLGSTGNLASIVPSGVNWSSALMACNSERPWKNTNKDWYCLLPFSTVIASLILVSGGISSALLRNNRGWPRLSRKTLSTSSWSGVLSISGVMCSGRLVHHHYYFHYHSHSLTVDIELGYTGESSILVSPCQPFLSSALNYCVMPILYQNVSCWSQKQILLSWFCQKDRTILQYVQECFSYRHASITNTTSSIVMLLSAIFVEMTT